MNFRELFELRKAEFHNTTKQLILDELNQLSGNNTRFGWQYEDGYYFCNTKNKDVLVVLKSDFEPYLFDSLAVLPAVGHPLEYGVDAVSEAADLVNSISEEETEV